MSLHHWINDGLTVVFFFLIGLEVRQEFAHGSLRDRTRTRIAVIAGVAGVCLPAVIYAVIVGSGDSLQGWGVVVGTDTAFMLGALALLGPARSGQLRVFLLTVTVVDDFLAVSNIGFVYSENIRLIPLLVSLACLTALWLLGRARQWRAAPYILVVIVLWFSTIESGVHPSLAGMVAGLLIPAYPTQRHKVEAAPELFRDFWQSPSAASGRAVSRGLAKGTAVNERIHEYLRVPTALIVGTDLRSRQRRRRPAWRTARRSVQCPCDLGSCAWPGSRQAPRHRSSHIHRCPTRSGPITAGGRHGQCDGRICAIGDGIHRIAADHRFGFRHISRTGRAGDRRRARRHGAGCSTGCGDLPRGSDQAG